ncbi:hypothetical protein Dfulv_29725 [Dactylosporangium fulvum]|uniref:FtsX-like permease family protein n=1 Tax=Dactylosporangium fulvum TaxID=53359 RepID=A0ABY5VRB4_9ACTN|nr:hypothetical protein [Dactylosporangium fulvum]UWP79336.1 hypothetical protein Dfulv_29725 [Dactylosporangium fulvum]
MTALVLTMLRSRWGRALTVALLTALATACAVAAPVYVHRVDRQIVANEVAHADITARNIQLSGLVEASGGITSTTFENLADGWLDAPGYASVFSAQFPAQPADLEAASAEQISRITFREGLCEHVVVVSGRCLMGVGETVLSVSSAQRLGLRPGAAVSLVGSQYMETLKAYVPAGDSTGLTVVGIVRPRDTTEPYWGTSGALADTASPAFAVDRRTLATFVRPSELQTFEAYPTPGAISVETLPELREWLTGAKSRNSDTARISTDLDDLLDRIDKRRAQVRATVPFAVAPLLVLAWAVIILAVSAATRARRFEHGIIALRGVARHWRWWLAIGETLTAVSIGAVAGFSATGGWTTPGAPQYAAVAVLGVVLVSAAVGIRTVSAPVAALLREVDRRGSRRGVMVVLVAVAATVATFQLRGAPGGVAMVAPALVMLAVALLAARALPLVADRSARRALRRGRLTGALAALRLARRPIGARLLVVLTVALASLGFAAAATAVLDERQAAVADVQTGAPVVLSVEAASRAQLLRAVRAADPDGRFAMAVVPVPANPGAPAALAVDATRLASVAIWRRSATAVPPADLAGLLRPPVAGAPVLVTGDRIDLDITVTQLDRSDVGLEMTVAPTGGQAAMTAYFGSLRLGRHTYSIGVPCTGGCRVVAVTVKLPPYLGPTVTLTVHNPPATEWRLAPGASALSATGGGVAFTLPATGRDGAGTIRPVDAPEVLPVVSTGPLPPDGAFGGLDRKAVAAKVVATVDRLPRLGDNGAFVDLEYADRLALDSDADGAEVWLSADAPQAIVDTLVANGLAVGDRRTVADARALLAGEGTALGLRFYLIAGLLAVALGGAALVVGTLGTNRTDLRALRAQGLPARAAALVEPLAALRLVLTAGLAGVLAGVVAWLVAAGSMPGLNGTGVPPPGPPGLALGGALLVLAVVALATTVRRR